MPDRVSVSSAEFIRNIGYWQNEALRRPISITHHGRERLVLAPPDLLTPASGVDAGATAALTTLRADASAVLESLDEGFIAFDAAMHVTSSNAVTQAFLGIGADDLHGASVLDVMPQPLASVLSDRLHRVARSRKAEMFEAGAFDGRHIAVRVFPMAAGVGALFRNTTEQHELRRKLEEGDAQGAALRCHTTATSIRLDARARIEAIDDAFCEWSGFGATDIIGHRFIDLVSGTQRREVGELIERVLREGAARSAPLTLLGKRGEEMSGHISLAPILTDFVPHGVLGIWIRCASDRAQAAA
jgi:PAS domain S-box-containing protein